MKHTDEIIGEKSEQNCSLDEEKATELGSIYQKQVVLQLLSIALRQWLKGNELKRKKYGCSFVKIVRYQFEYKDGSVVISRILTESFEFCVLIKYDLLRTKKL